MKCELCNKNTRCSCRGWGCSWCNNNNKAVSFNNELIKFWLDKSIIRDKLKWIRWYVDKIDSYTMYEFLSDTISEEEFNKAVENYNPKQRVISTKDWIVKLVNPNKMCYYEFPGTWSRCKYCGKIYKFMQWKECPAYQEKTKDETPGTTDAENK